MMAAEWREALGALSVFIAVLAFVIYGWQTMTGHTRPHPLSWFLFGILSVTGYWIQRDQGAGAGSWALLAMTVICFVLAGASVARGERQFSRQEWALLAVGCLVFALYLFTREPVVAAILVTLVDTLGFGPTFVRGWREPHKDSIASFALNGAKYIPSILAMQPITLATSLYPAALVLLNAGVAAMLLLRRRTMGTVGKAASAPSVG